MATYIGGNGKDTLTGGSARNILIGGARADTLVGGPDEDLLICGTTTFSGDLAALEALFEHWNGGDYFASRVLDLSEGRVLGAPALNATRVVDDKAANMLAGGGGLDWFFGKLTGPALDKIADLDLVRGEQVNTPVFHPPSWDLSINDPGAAYQAYYASIESCLLAAAEEWSTHLVSTVPSSIQIEVDITASVSRAGGIATSVFVSNRDGVNIFEQGVANEIRTGIDLNGATPDLYILINPNYLAGELWFDPSPHLRTTPVPSDKTDAFSVMLHELAHAIGFNGWRDGTTGNLPGSDESTFDKWETFDGTNLYFNGPAAELVYGGPVPITYGNNFHVGNASPRPGSDLIPDMMNGLVYNRGVRYDISPLDLAILADAGVGITG